MGFDTAREHQTVNAGSARVSISECSGEDGIDALAEHCIAARQIVEKNGSPLMLCLIDMLLFEIGTKLAADLKSHGKKPECDDRN